MTQQDDAALVAAQTWVDERFPPKNWSTYHRDYILEAWLEGHAAARRLSEQKGEVRVPNREQLVSLLITMRKAIPSHGTYAEDAINAYESMKSMLAASESEQQTPVHNGWNPERKEGREMKLLTAERIRQIKALGPGALSFEDWHDLCDMAEAWRRAGEGASDVEIIRRFQAWAITLTAAEARLFWDDVNWLRNTSLAAAPAAAKGEWISVKERCPERNSQCLYLHQRGFVVLADEWRDDQHGLVATHWMPLPAPPTGDAAKEGA